MSNLTIHLKEISKKYNQHFLYKNLSLDILPTDKIVITGNNGSGKSTLLKIIIGLVSPTSGNVEYFIDNTSIDKHQWYKYISLAAPYMAMIDDFSINELTEHLFIFKNYQIKKKEVIDILGLNKHIQKPLKYFSSGMKQKVRLLFAITDSAPVLLLDEPISNLDAVTIDWYTKMIKEFAIHKTIIVFSNSQQQEYFFCNKHVDLSKHA